MEYAAAKAGMTGIMKYICRTYTRRGILANIVHPCVIETESSCASAMRTRQPGRSSVARSGWAPGRPSDVAGMVAFLASSWGDYITGQEILVDGGRTNFRM